MSRAFTLIIKIWGVYARPKWGKDNNNDDLFLITLAQKIDQRYQERELNAKEITSS